MSPDSKAQPADWERYKPMLWQLWVQNGMTTQELMAQMKARYDFVSGKNDFDRQFRAWGWQKNLKPEDWFRVAQCTKKRKREHDKDSVVKFNGAIVDLGQKLKKKRLTFADEIRLSTRQSRDLFVAHRTLLAVSLRTARPTEQTNVSVPDSILIYTPGKFTNNQIRIDNIPWMTFLKSGNPLFRQLISTQSYTPSSVSLMSMGRDEAQERSLQQVASITSAAGSPPEAAPLCALVYSIANNFRSSTYGGRFRRADIAQCFDVLERQSTSLVTNIFITFQGPTSQAFLMVLAGEAFWRDDTRIAEILLSQMEMDVNERFRLDDFEVVMLADLIKSAPMADVFVHQGGDLARATRPFLRLSYLDISPEQYEAILERLIDARHEDIARSFPTILRTRKPALIWKAISSNTLSAFGLACGVASLRARKYDFPTYAHAQTLGPNWLSLYGPMILAEAAFNGMQEEVTWLIQQDIGLDRTSDIWPVPSLGSSNRATLREPDPNKAPIRGTALQFAIRNRFDTVVTALVEAGATCAIEPGSTLPLPIRGLQRSYPDLLSKVLDAALDCSQHHAVGSHCVHCRRSIDLLFESHHPTSYYPLTFAVIIGDHTLISRLMSVGYAVKPPTRNLDVINTPLMAALQRRDRDLVRKFLQMGADIVYRGHPRTNGHSDIPNHDLSFNLLVEAIWQNSFDLFEDSITHEILNAPHFITSDHAVTPLLAALGMRERLGETGKLHNHVLVLELIQKFGAMVNTTEQSAISPLAGALMANCEGCVNLIRLEGGVLTPKDVDFVAADITWALWEALHYQRCGTYVTFSDDCTCARQAPLTHSLAAALISGITQERTELDEADEDLAKAQFTNFDRSAPCLTRVFDDYSLQTEGALWLLEVLEIKPYIAASESTHPCCQSAIDERRRRPFSRFEYAIRRQKYDLVESFVQKGADPNEIRLFSATSNDGKLASKTCELAEDYMSQMTPFLQAAQVGDVVSLRILIEYRADIHRPAQGYLGRTAFQAAVESGSAEAVRFFMNEHSVSVNEPPAPNGGLTALQVAAMKGLLDIALELIEAGAVVDADRAEVEGYTALEVAAKFGRLDMVQLLINAGADIGNTNFGTKQFERAVEFAREEGFPYLVQLLREQREELHGRSVSADQQPDPTGFTGEAPLDLSLPFEQPLEMYDWDLDGPSG